MMTERINSKEAMPVLGPRGLTQDYYNYVNYLRIVGEWMGGGEQAINSYLCENPLPLYTEAFSEKVYDNVVNSYNRDDVTKIEELVRELNALGKAGSLSLERWKVIDSQIWEILYGTSDKDPGITTR